MIEAINSTAGGFYGAHEELLRAIALQVGDRLLPDLIQHMVKQSDDDTGMDDTEMADIREVLAAEYDSVARPGERASHAAVEAESSAALRRSVAHHARVASSAGATAAMLTSALPLGHHLGRREEPVWPSVEPLDEATLFTLPRGWAMEHVLEWDVDFLDLEPTELMQLAATIFRHSGVLDAFHVPAAVLAAFLAEVCSRYPPNPYHNFSHGVHVLHGAYLQARAGTGAHAAPLTLLELFALLVAAIGHDLEHPGVTNAFLTRTHAPLAIEHNDRSVLESHHAATTFHVLARPSCALFATLEEWQKHEVRELIIATILATDMAHHSEMVSELSQHAAGYHGAAAAAIAPRDVLRTFCHVADLANAALAWDLAEPWSVRVGAEAVAQSVEEHRLGLKLPKTAKLVPYTREELAARQLVFIDDWVRPLYKCAAILFPGAKARLQQIERNREACKKIIAGMNLTTL